MVKRLFWLCLLIIILTFLLGFYLSQQTPPFTKDQIRRKYIVYELNILRFDLISRSRFCRTTYFADYAIPIHRELTTEELRFCNQTRYDYILFSQVTIYTQRENYQYNVLNECFQIPLPTCQKLEVMLKSYRIYLFEKGLCYVSNRTWHTFKKGHFILFKTQNSCEALNVS